jgi:prepilin-type processing-associated H-X9-DG protein
MRPQRMKSLGRCLLCVITIASAATVAGCGSNRVTENCRREKCFNHLRLIGLALQEYYQDEGCFPPPAIRDKDSGILYSWRVAVLPYIDGHLHTMYRYDKAWDSPENETIRMRRPSEYGCPSTQGEPYGETDYLMVTGRPRKRSGSEMTLGSDDIIVVEVSNSGVHWAEPRDLPFADMSFNVNDPSKMCIRSHHPGGAHVLRCDGSVEFVENSLAPASLREVLSGANGPVEGQ